MCPVGPGLVSIAQHYGVLGGEQRVDLARGAIEAV
jgi:hypothetical protein